MKECDADAILAKKYEGWSCAEREFDCDEDACVAEWGACHDVENECCEGSECILQHDHYSQCLSECKPETLKNFEGAASWSKCEGVELPEENEVDETTPEENETEETTPEENETDETTPEENEDDEHEY